MAAPSFIAASTPSTDATGAWAATCHAPGAAGRIIILHVLQDGVTSNAISFTSATNIENLAGTANQWTKIPGPISNGCWPIGTSGTAALHHIWIGRSVSTSAPTFTGGNTTSEDVYWRFYEFSDVSTGTTLATVIENSTAGNATSTSATDGTITDAGVTTLGPDRLGLQFVGISDDNAINVFTGETGGNWTLAVPGYSESSGTDASIGLQISYPSPFSSALDEISVAGPYGAGGTEEEFAQSFTTIGAITADSAYLKLLKTGSPGDNVVVEIQTDSSGKPSGTTVGSSVSIAGSSLTTSAAWYKFSSLAASLSATTTYWLVLRRSGARDTSNYYSHGEANLGSNPVAGNIAIRSSGTWTADANYDLAFAVLSSADQTGATIDGGTATNADSADGWGVVGFALIGTTVVDTTPVPRYGFVNFQDPGVFMKRIRDRIYVPKLWLPEGATI